MGSEMCIRDRPLTQGGGWDPIEGPFRLSRELKFPTELTFSLIQLRDLQCTGDSQSSHRRQVKGPPGNLFQQSQNTPTVQKLTLQIKPHPLHRTLSPACASGVKALKEYGTQKGKSKISKYGIFTHLGQSGICPIAQHRNLGSVKQLINKSSKLRSSHCCLPYRESNPIKQQGLAEGS